jgi:hypothetical protein
VWCTSGVTSDWTLLLLSVDALRAIHSSISIDFILKTIFGFHWLEKPDIIYSDVS